MDNLAPPKAGARAASSFVFDKAFVNGEWVAASSGKTFEGTHVEASDTCICGPVSIKYLIYTYMTVYLLMYVVQWFLNHQGM